MATDQTQHGRRPHGHRRRGNDRRGADRRPRHSPPEDDGRDRADRDHVDVDQIMREIRSRIAERKGVDLSNQQILDLAARRLEAVLAPQGLDPRLMEELRQSAGAEAARPPQAERVEPFDEASLYHSSNGLVRVLRTLFRPLLSLLINPKALAAALGAQSELAAKQSAREAEQRRRQSEWNALHYEILRRVVTDAARAEIDMRDLLQRVESLAARVDFADRRVGAVEQAQYQAHPPRGADAPAATTDGGEPPSRPDTESADGSRRRRRRRRGRRSGGGPQGDGPIGEAAAEAGSTEDASAEASGNEFDETGESPEAFPGETGPEPAPSQTVVVASDPNTTDRVTPDPASSESASAESGDAQASPGFKAPPVAQGWIPPSRPQPGPGSEQPDRPQTPAPEPGADPSSTDR